MKPASRIVGWSLVALGGVSIFVGASPLFPIRGEAYILGVALFAAGSWILAGRELRDTIRRGLRAARQARRWPRRTGEHAAGGVALLDPLLPVRILKLARGHGGILTVARVAMELNVPLDQAQAGMDECVRAGNALPDFDIPRGHALYRFPEFTEPEPPRLSN